MKRKSYISIIYEQKKEEKKEEKQPKVGSLTIAAEFKRPDRAFIYPEMVMQYNNSCR